MVATNTTTTGIIIAMMMTAVVEDEEEDDDEEEGGWSVWSSEILASGQLLEQTTLADEDEADFKLLAEFVFALNCNREVKNPPETAVTKADSR
jgi:hypothetical protein